MLRAKLMKVVSATFKKMADFFFEIWGTLSYQRMLLHSAPVYLRVLVISRPI